MHNGMTPKSTKGSIRTGCGQLRQKVNKLQKNAFIFLHHPQFRQYWKVDVKQKGQSRRKSQSLGKEVSLAGAKRFNVVMQNLLIQRF